MQIQIAVWTIDVIHEEGNKHMIPGELLKLISGGENNTVEFKKSTTDITKDVYESICAFSNRDGGHVFLGIKDNGVILGIQQDRIDQMKKDFVTAINNENKIFPPLYLSPVEFEQEGRHILYIRVPIGISVCRCNGRIYDRNHEADIDITNNEGLVYRLYARKQDSYYVNKVFPHIGCAELRPELIDRVRRMARSRSQKHPWLQMTNEELLRSSGLILRDPETNKEGITLASILLFGSDELILSVLSHHKTDAIFRVFNVDRYDDRDVIITNLLDSYDRMIFGEKHLNDLFVMDGLQSVSARDKILREIVSNSLAHRDFSSAYVAKIVIERDQIFTENCNRSHGYGSLNISTFEPFPKNPPISKVFREIGLADELGSGMRNTYKYTRLYSGGEPQFVEGDIFRTIIPLNEAATATVGPSITKQNGEVGGEVDMAVLSEMKLDKEQLKNLLDYCSTGRSRKELQEYCGIKSQSYFRDHILTPILNAGLIRMSIPDKPKSSRQKYISKKK